MDPDVFASLINNAKIETKVFILYIYIYKAQNREKRNMKYFDFLIGKFNRYKNKFDKNIERINLKNFIRKRAVQVL